MPTDLAAWSRLARLLSLGKRSAEKGSCHIGLADLEEWGRGMVLIALPPDPLEAVGFERDLRRIAARVAGQCFLGAASLYDGQDQERLDRLAELSQATGLPKVAVGDVLMHRSNRRPLADDPFPVMPDISRWKSRRIPLPECHIVELYLSSRGMRDTSSRKPGSSRPLKARPCEKPLYGINIKK